MINVTHQYIGSLFAPRWEDRPLELNWEKLGNIRGEKSEALGWFFYDLVTNRPLVGEEMSNGQNEFIYRFFIRQSEQRFLLVCPAKEVFEFLLDFSKLKNRVLSPTVDITSLVAMLVETPKDYALSSVYASVDGYGQAFRSISMYGTDLTDAKLFREISSSVSPYRVTLRDQIRRENVLTISSKGEVSFIYRDANTFRQIDDALRFLAKNKFMDWSLN